MGTKATFGFPRASPSFTYSTGSWNPSYPISNLTKLPLSRVARTTNSLTTSTIILGTSAVPQAASMVALVRHNLSLTAKIRLRVWSEAARTNLIYSGPLEDVWPVVFNYSATEWEHDVYWDGRYTDEEMKGTAWTWYKRFSEPAVMVGAFEIYIDDVANQAGYIQAGFVEIAQAFEASYNFEWGFQYGYRWRSQVTEAIGGSRYVDRRVKPRVVRGNFPNALRNEALSRFLEMQRQLDTNIPVLFVPLPAETAQHLRTVMLAQQIDPGLITMKGTSIRGLIDSVPLSLEEIVG